MEFNKTDEELKQMTDDELFEYLDAKASHLKAQSVPLDQYHTKKYAAASLGREMSTKELRKAKEVGKKGEWVKAERIREAAKSIKVKEPELYVKHHKTNRKQWFD